MSDVLTRVRAGWLIDVVAGEVLRDRVIGIRGDRIESIGDDDGSPVEVDLSEHTVLPGLIDCHAHLIGEIEGGHGYAQLVQRTGAQEALTGVRNARDTVMAGFTSVRDVGTFRAFVDVALRDAIEGMGRTVFSHGVMNWTKDDHWGFTNETGVMLKVVNGDWKVE